MLLTMVKDDRFARDDQLALDEIPAYLDGYDLPLAADADDVIHRELLPRIERRYPELLEPLRYWLRGDGLADVPSSPRGAGATRRRTLTAWRARRRRRPSRDRWCRR